MKKIVAVDTLHIFYYCKAFHISDIISIETDPCLHIENLRLTLRNERIMHIHTQIA